MCPSGACPRAGGFPAAPRARVRAVADHATACAAQFTAVRALDAGAAQTRPAFPQAVTPSSAELRPCPRPQEHDRGFAPCAQGGALERARAARARAGQQHVRAQQLVRVVLVPAAHRQRLQRGRISKLQVGAVPVQQLPRLARALRRARRAARRPCAAAPADPARTDRRAYLGGAAATLAHASPAPYRAPAAPCSGAPCFGVRATAHCWGTDTMSAAREGGGAGRRPAVRQAAECGGARHACGCGAGGRGLAEHGAVGRRERDILRDLAHAVAQRVARVQRRVVLGLHLRARRLGNRGWGFLGSWKGMHGRGGTSA